jgi:hypothetical protein
MFVPSHSRHLGLVAVAAPVVAPEKGTMRSLLGIRRVARCAGDGNGGVTTTRRSLAAILL